MEHAVGAVNEYRHVILTIPHRMPRRLQQTVPLLLLLAFALTTGLRGIEYPYHPDEETNLHSVRQAFKTKLLLPDNYIYPSMFHWLQVISALPDVVITGYEHRAEQGFLNALIGTIEGDYDKMLISRLDDDTYVLRTRQIHLFISLFTIVWIYFATLAWRRSIPQAFLAAGLIGLSWEISTHSRWIAPDAVMMQFGALSLLCAVLALTRSNPEQWLNYAALAAALAAGTKYPGGLALIGVWAAAWLRREVGQSKGVLWGRFLKRLARLTAIFGLSFLFVTPGIVLQPAMFVHDIRRLFEHYGEGHRGYTVSAGVEHLARNLDYLALVLWSRWEIPTLGVTCLIVLGAWHVLRREPRFAALLLVVPLVYLLVISNQRVFFVRNLLFLTPFMAVLAAAGASQAWQWLRLPALRALFAAGLIAIGAANAKEMVRTANTIVAYTAQGKLAALKSLAAYVEAHPDTQFLASPTIYNNLAALGNVPPNVHTEGKWHSFDYVLWEHRSARLLPTYGYPAPRRGLVTAVFGPEYFNIDFYPSRYGPYLALTPDVFQDFGYQNGVFGRSFSTIEYPDKNQVSYVRYGSVWVPEWLLRQPAGATVSWAPTFYQADRITLRTGIRLEEPERQGVSARIVVQEGDTFTTLWETPSVSDTSQAIKLDLTRYGGIPIRIFFEVRATVPESANAFVLWNAPDVRYE